MWTLLTGIEEDLARLCSATLLQAARCAATATATAAPQTLRRNLFIGLSLISDSLPDKQHNGCVSPTHVHYTCLPYHQLSVPSRRDRSLRREKVSNSK